VGYKKKQNFTLISKQMKKLQKKFTSKTLSKKNSEGISSVFIQGHQISFVTAS
jgi:hypothetical protein